MKTSKIIWTKTDEAPALASYALLPVVRSFLKNADIEVEVCDISLAGRIIAGFPENLTQNQRLLDHLSELGKLVKIPDVNIIKLPNISASMPQLQAAIKELKEKGYLIPNYPETPETPNEEQIKQRYLKILGSAVNPVLREGNSDRRAPVAVKSFARQNPHKMMKPWLESRSSARVAHMDEKDFFGSEISITLDKSCTARLEFQTSDGQISILKDDLSLIAGEVLDTAVMNIKALRLFYTQQIKEAKKNQSLLSLHLKATMMKISDPIMFGHCVSVFFKDIFVKHSKILKTVGVDVNNGLSDLLDKVGDLPRDKQEEIKKDIQAVYENQPELAMVDSDKGITNLHAPNHVIVDASMPNIIRDGGKMWNRKGQLQDTIALIPDRSYATMYQRVIENCKTHGQFNPASMGSVSNVGLMAMKAEEYGSHDKTFESLDSGIIRLVDDHGTCLMAQDVEKGDIFRMCQTKDVAISNWVKLGVERAQVSRTPAVFWLDQERAHDAQIIKKVKVCLLEHKLADLEIAIMKPVQAMDFSLERVRRGEDTIAITGNVLRDYLTDLFPILELGTSSRMLSIVPLLNGGGLFETGAGGSAPKHVEQFLQQGHLRWDSLGEYCALVPSLEQVGHANGNKKAKIFAQALDKAIGEYLEQGKTPSRNVNEIDNRGGTFYIALFWAKALAEQSDDKEIKQKFILVAQELEENEILINTELLSSQGSDVDISGYFLPDPVKTENQMRPSPTLNSIIDNL
jgi:isocitrate dehydrogenase